MGLQGSFPRYILIAQLSSLVSSRNNNVSMLFISPSVGECFLVLPVV